jgi:hypothetical protein
MRRVYDGQSKQAGVTAKSVITLCDLPRQLRDARPLAHPLQSVRYLQGQPLWPSVIRHEPIHTFCCAKQFDILLTS